jgi:hypothetical protein
MKRGKLSNLLLPLQMLFLGNSGFFKIFILAANPQICENCEVQTREKEGMTVSQPIKPLKHYNPRARTTKFALLIYLNNIQQSIFRRNALYNAHYRSEEKLWCKLRGSEPSFISQQSHNQMRYSPPFMEPEHYATFHVSGPLHSSLIQSIPARTIYSKPSSILSFHGVVIK